MEVEVRPDVWQPDQLVEWGILNPNGPTKCQITVVEAGPGVSALVWTLHHFLLPKCLVLAAGRFHDPGVLREALVKVFQANGHAEQQRGSSGPRPGSAAAPWRESRGGNHPAGARGLRGIRSAVLPVKNEDWETHRVFEAEIRKRETLAELAGDDFYMEWMRLAVHPTHVEQVSSYFDSAWREAMRRHHQASVQPQPDGAPASPAASFSRSGQAV